MIAVSATQLRNNLFTYLNQTSKGETIIICNNKKEIARLLSTDLTDWRDKMTIKPQLLVSPAEMMKPVAYIWEDYVCMMPEHGFDLKKCPHCPIGDRKRFNPQSYRKVST